MVQALVLIDMQRDFFNDSELERCRDDLVAACNELIARAKASDVPIFSVRTVHTRDKSTWALNMLEDDSGFVFADDPGSDLVEGLDAEGSIDVVKTRDNAFFGTDLASAMQSRGVTSFALCGVSTESCIAATATDAYARDLQVVLVDRATASVDEDLHRHTLDTLHEQYRQPVVEPDEVTFE